jgi:hypothetical protein
MAVRNTVGNSGGAYLRRTTNLPTLSAFTICGWFRVNTIQAWSTTFCIDMGNISGYFYVQSNSNGLVLYPYYSNTSNSGTNSNINQISSRSLEVGDVYFVAMTASGYSDIKAYSRFIDEKVFTSSSGTMGGTANWTVTNLRVGQSVFFDYASSDECHMGSYWNVKCWNRVLTSAELLIESYYRRVMFPASLNFHWPLDKINDLKDYGGLGRDPTQTVLNTALSNEDSTGLWHPRNRLIILASSPTEDRVVLSEQGSTYKQDYLESNTYLASQDYIGTTSVF